MSTDETTAPSTEAAPVRRRKDVGGPAKGAGSGTTRPPFAPGNAMHLTSGASSPRIYGALARDLSAGLLDRRPDLAAYPDTVDRWATASAISLLLRRHLDNLGVIDPATNLPRESILRRLAAEDSRAERTGMLLGLDPSSQARVARDRAATAHLAVDIDAILARGRETAASRPAIVEPDPVAALVAGVMAEERERWEAANADWTADERADAERDATVDGDDETEPDEDGDTT